MDRKTLESINDYKKEMIGLGYDLERIFLVLNESVYKRDRFQICGFSVIYADIKEKFCFKEF